MEQTELLELIAKSQSGSRDAQEKLVLAVQNRVYYHCLKTLRNEDDAMDAVQDILISMLGGLNTLRSPESFWAWLNQITCRTCCRRMARQHREVQLLAPEELLEENLDDQTSPEDALDSEENRRIIYELVDGLPETQRLCVLMYYYDEIPVKDIASILETTEGTVKSRLHYARQRIKKGVERYASQGFTLYGVSPLPFLRYFLQQEAARTCLDAAAAKALGEAVLAAGAAGGAAVGTAAAGGALAAGGTAAISGGVKVAAVGLAGLLLAGAVTGGILFRRQETPPPEPVQNVRQEIPVKEPDIPAAVRPQPEPAAPEPPVQPEILSEEEPEAPPAAPKAPVAAPLSTVVQPAAVPEPEPEAPPAVTAPDPAPAVPAEEPDTGPPSWLFPAPDSKPEAPSDPQPGTPAPEVQPELQPSYVPPVQRPTYVPPVFPVDPGPGTEPGPGPSVDPGVDPDPGPGDDPDPGPSEDPEPEVISKTLVDFGLNSGYGYTSSFAEEWGGGLPENLTFTSSDTDVVRIDSHGNFSTFGPGEAVLTAVSPDDASCQYALTVTVQDHFDWLYTIDPYEHVELAQGYSTVWAIPIYYLGSSSNMLSVEWTPDSPDVVCVMESLSSPHKCQLFALSPGTTTVTGVATFEVPTIDDVQLMQGAFTFQVTVTAPSEESAAMVVNGSPLDIYEIFPGSRFSCVESGCPDVVSVNGRFLSALSPGTADIFCYRDDAAREMNAPAAILHVTVEPGPDPAYHKDISELGYDFIGYGFTGEFSHIWPGLPEGMAYSSSSPGVVYIDSASGAFYARFPGTAILTAVDPEDPEHPYTLMIQVRNRFHWEAPVLSATVHCGSSDAVTCSFPQLEMAASNIISGRIEWTSSDPSIADIDKDYPHSCWYDIRIIGYSPGTVTFTGVVTYQLMSPLGIQEVEDTVTLEVTVVEAPAAG